MNRLERFQLSGALQAEEIGFDPDLAREYLARAGGGAAARRLLPRVITRYARDMAAGRWVMNGEPLILDPEGNLLDGRHRLAAVIEARVAVRFLVVRGVDPALTHTLDTGATRSLASVMRCKGEPHARLLAAMVGLLARFAGESHDRKHRPTTCEVVELVRTTPGLRAAAALVGGRAWWRRAPRPALAAAMFIVGPSAEVQEFMEAVRTGVGLPSGSPILSLRRFLFDSRGRASRVSGVRSLAAILNAYDQWCDDGALPRGAAPESWN